MRYPVFFIRPRSQINCYVRSYQPASLVSLARDSNPDCFCTGEPHYPCCADSLAARLIERLHFLALLEKIEDRNFASVNANITVVSLVRGKPFSLTRTHSLSHMRAHTHSLTHACAHTLSHTCGRTHAHSHGLSFSHDLISK